MSSQVPVSTTSVYGGIFDSLWPPSLYPIVAAVTTIAVSLAFFCKFWETRNISRDKGISSQGHSTRDERNPDISISAQASSTPRRQSVDHFPGDEGHFGILVPLQVPPITSEPHTLGDRDAQKREADRDSTPGILTALPTINHSPMEAGNKDDHDIAIPIEMPFIILEQSSIDREGEDMRNAEAGRSVDPDFPIPTEAPTVATESYSRLRRDGGMESEEVPSVTLFQGSSNFNISNTNISAIGGNATIIQFGDGQFTEVQRNLICDYIANLTVLPDIKNNLQKHVLTQSIISLPRAEAVFNDYQTKKKSGPCFEGTRVALLREMADWVTVPDESRMYVLSGLAGIGKSTVAYTIASRAADLNLLGASFFFSRGEADRNNAKKFFTTIAYQLCVYNETFAKAIGDVLNTERGSAATTKDPQDQLHALILDPLRSIIQSRSRPVLIVVDALDECDEEDAFSVLTGLRQLVWDLPLFKVILTTRPQPYLDPFLGNANQGDHKIFHLQDIEDKVVDGDIRVYLNHCLSMDQVQKRYPKRQWRAGDEDIDSLVRAAGRLFIIASTAVRYILDKSASNPAAQMQKLLRATALDHTPLKDLDHFYTVILRDVVPEDCDDDDILSRYQAVVGAIIFVQRPLPVSTLSHLIDIDIDEIRAVLDNLQSVILLGDDDAPRIYHKSFPDYLTDQARCKDPRLRIDPRIRPTQLVTRCFEIMDKHLKYNILGLGKLAQFMSNEDGLKEDGVTDEQLQEKIPQHLRYACIYWANHLGVAAIEDTDLMNGLAKFADEHMLYWFEVLSLIGKSESAHLGILVVLKLLKSSSDSHQLLSDALRFVSKFYEIIKQSALHTYYSALAFTPRDSLLYRRYIKEEMHKICAVEGGPKTWDALVANLSHEESVDTIRFSLNSALFVSWSEDDRVDVQGKFKIWDAATGMPISAIPGHRFAVANDFSTVASSEDKTITFYDVNGSARGTMFTTSSTIQELALSSESSRVAAALSDGTVWLWDSRNAEVIDSFDGFKGTGDWSQLKSFKFSPTGTRLAYSSANGIVKLRDGISGRFIADLQCGSKHDLEFSGDGSRIASLSRTCGLTLWNSDSGALIGAVKDVGDIKLDLGVLAISADGSLVATANRDKVKLWSGDNDSLAQIEVLDNLDLPGSMAFSPDNILAIATDFDIKLYNLKTHSFISTLPFGGDPAALAFSPDYTHLAVGTYDGGVYLWDIRGIDASSPPSNEEVTGVVALALSRDCSRLACGFEDGTVELWNTSPTKRRIASHQAHKRWAEALGFGPADDGLFASGSDDGIIKLWNGGDGSLRETLKVPSGLRAVTLSNNVLVAAGDSDVTLWSLDTLSLFHTFKQSGDIVSIAENSTLIAVAVIGDDSEDSEDGNDSEDSAESKESEDEVLESVVSLLDVVNHTTIATFNVSHEIHTMTFIPDNSQLVVQSRGSVFLSLDLVNKNVIEAPPLEHLIQLPDTPLWHGIPMWHCRDKEQHYFSALFPQHKSPVPVLWIPRDLPVTVWTQGSSMIALGCGDGRVMLLRLPTSRVD